MRIDTYPYLQGEYYLNQNNYSFDKHSIVIGSSGSGKSKFISLLIHKLSSNPEFKQKYRVVVIDPHAALEEDIGGFSKVIDFKALEGSISLFNNQVEDLVSATEILLDLFKSLMQDKFNSKLERVLRHSIYLLLTKREFNFITLRKLLLEVEYRSSCLKELECYLPVSVVDFFLTDFNDLKTKSYGEAISPIIAFIDEMTMIPVFNETKDLTSLKEMIDENFITLFSLDNTKLGSRVIQTISGLIMQQILTLIQSHAFDLHILFIIDEVSVVENLILTRFLSEARKYHLSLILAGQYFNQISSSLQEAIYANVINYYIFRVSIADATSLVDHFSMKVPLDDTRERKIKILSELNNRECIVRIEANGLLLPAFKGKTLDFISQPREKKEETFEKKNGISKKKDINFHGNVEISLKDILISTSSSRKDF